MVTREDSAGDADSAQLERVGGGEGAGVPLGGHRGGREEDECAHGTEKPGSHEGLFLQPVRRVNGRPALSVPRAPVRIAAP